MCDTLAEVAGMCAQVPPDVASEHSAAVETAVAELRYGSININVATMLGFSVPKLTWGAYPGNKPQVITLSRPSSWNMQRA